jgi:hypothetical protein
MQSLFQLHKRHVCLPVVLHRFPQHARQMWMVAHSFVRLLRLPETISELPTPLPRTLHCHYTGITDCHKLTVNFHGLYAFCPENRKRTGRHCSPDAGQACFVCTSEKACHLVGGRMFERITQSHSTVSITFTEIHQGTLPSDIPSYINA